MSSLGISARIVCTISTDGLHSNVVQTSYTDYLEIFV